MFSRPSMSEDALINGAYAIVATFADCGFSDAEIKRVLHPKMIDAFLAMRRKRDDVRALKTKEGE